MTDGKKQIAAPAKPATLRADPAPAGKAVASSKPRTAAVVPIKASEDIPFPGGVVSSVGNRRINVVVDPTNGAKVMGGSDYPAFNQVLL